MAEPFGAPLAVNAAAITIAQTASPDNARGVELVIVFLGAA